MPRPPSVVPYTKVHLHIPVPLKAEMDLRHFSELEGRVPYGVTKSFVVEALSRALHDEALDLAPFDPTIQPGSAIVRGSHFAIAALRRILEALHHE